MNYKETLFFVAKCLTISHKKKNTKIIEQQLIEQKIDWDAVVKVSTAHYVFPALYCNLKRADFLHYLPKDLVEYMDYITELNRERNEQIIAQAKEINEVLLAENITPIFLKGTGNLLEGLYDDIAERMVGDIDIILSEEEVFKADKILRKNNYSSKSLMFDDHRHLPRLTKENRIAAIELHKEFLEIPHRNHFNYETVKNAILTQDNSVTVLGNIEKTTLTILSNQITDDAFEKGTLLLRNLYDFYLQAKKINLEELSVKYAHFEEIIISYWAAFSLVFDKELKPDLINNKGIKKHLKKVLWLLNNPKISRYYNNIKDLKIYISSRFGIFIKAFSNKSNLTFIISRITSLEWFKRRVLRIK